MHATSVSSSLVPEAAWTVFELPAAQLHALRQRIEAVAPEHALRAAFLSLIRPALASTRPDQLERFDRLEALFPKPAPFAFQSMQIMMVQLAAAGHLYRGDLPLDDAANALALTGTDLIWNVHIMRPLIAACEGDFARLLEAYASAPRIIFVHGSMLYERRSRREAAIYYDGIPSDALRMVAPGFWQALLRRLGLEGEATLHVYGPLSCELVAAWS